jgi:hypothetical protein
MHVSLFYLPSSPCLFPSCLPPLQHATSPPFLPLLHDASHRLLPLLLAVSLCYLLPVSYSLPTCCLSSSPIPPTCCLSSLLSPIPFLHTVSPRLRPLQPLQHGVSHCLLYPSYTQSLLVFYHSKHATSPTCCLSSSPTLS